MIVESDTDSDAGQTVIAEAMKQQNQKVQAVVTGLAEQEIYASSISTRLD